MFSLLDNIDIHKCMHVLFHYTIRSRGPEQIVINTIPHLHNF